MRKRCTLFQKTPTQSNGTDALSHASTLPRETGVKNTTIKIRFMAEKLHLLALQKNKKNLKIPHFYQGVGKVLPVINTSTGLENELPAMMLVWAAYTFTIFTSGAVSVGRLAEALLCPRCKTPPWYRVMDQRHTHTHKSSNSLRDQPKTSQLRPNTLRSNVATRSYK